MLQGLAGTFGNLTDLEDLESVTSGRLVAEQAGVPGISTSALAAGYGYTYINAAFAYPRPGGSRFNPEAWATWYAAWDCQTSLAEVAFHLTRALAAARARYDNETRYVKLLSDFDADFVDLRWINPRPPYLSADTSLAYPEGQKLASDLRSSGSNGIVYPSVRDPNGTCLMAF